MSALLRAFTRRHGARGGAPLVLVATRTPAAICWRRLEIGSTIAPGECPAVLIRMGDGGKLARMAQLLLLPFAKARVERQLARWSASGVVGYAVAPSCETPMWVYRVDSAAASYAHTHLMPRGTGWKAVRAAIRWWAGCDPAVAGLLVVAV
jgi:hypothetical protein